LPVLLADADVGLSPSQFETFHRVTREYLFAGIPVIGSSAFGIPEAVQHGVNGLLFDHADQNSLRRSVLAVLDDPALLIDLTAGAGGTIIRTVAQEVDDLVELYGECL
jgi:glycosyltransferase involved in cell wall biosynthesis